MKKHNMILTVFASAAVLLSACGFPAAERFITGEKAKPCIKPMYDKWPLGYMTGSDGELDPNYIIKGPDGEPLTIEDSLCRYERRDQMAKEGFAYIPRPVNRLKVDATPLVQHYKRCNPEEGDAPEGCGEPTFYVGKIHMDRGT